MKIILWILGLAFIGAIVVAGLFLSAYAVAVALIALVVYFIVDEIRLRSD